MPPIIVPPIAPTIKIGAYAFVTMASGKLSNSPKTNPINQPGHGNETQPMTNPIPKRLVKAAKSAVFLSGNGIGNIMPTETSPKANPLIKP